MVPSAAIVHFSLSPVLQNSARRPPGFTTPISAPPRSSDDSESSSESATRLPIVDSEARSSRAPSLKAVVMSAAMEPTGLSPSSWPLATAASTMLFTFLTVSSPAAASSSSLLLVSTATLPDLR